MHRCLTPGAEDKLRSTFPKGDYVHFERMTYSILSGGSMTEKWLSR